MLYWIGVFSIIDRQVGFDCLIIAFFHSSRQNRNKICDFLKNLIYSLENVVTITPRLIKSDLEHTIQLYEEKSLTKLELHLKIANIVKQSNDADK